MTIHAWKVFSEKRKANGEKRPPNTRRPEASHLGSSIRAELHVLRRDTQLPSLSPEQWHRTPRAAQRRALVVADQEERSRAYAQGSPHKATQGPNCRTVATFHMRQVPALSSRSPRNEI